MEQHFDFGGIELRRLSYLTAFASAIVTVGLIAGCSPVSDAVQNKAANKSSPAVTTPAPAPQPVPPKPVVSDLKSASATRHFKQDSGYSTAILETIWEPLPADIAGPIQHPADEAATIDPATDYDPKTNVVVPFSLTLTNTTKGFSIEKPSIAYSIFPIGSAKAPAYWELMSLETWDWHSDGWSTTKYNVAGVVDSKLIVQPGDYSAPFPTTEWSDPLEPGASVTLNGFFVYRDKLTPAAPKGTRWVLNNLSLQFWDQGNKADENPETLTLSGKLVPAAW